MPRITLPARTRALILFLFLFLKITDQESEKLRAENLLLKEKKWMNHKDPDQLPTLFGDFFPSYRSKTCPCALSRAELRATTITCVCGGCGADPQVSYELSAPVHTCGSRQPAVRGYRFKAVNIGKTFCLFKFYFAYMFHVSYFIKINFFSISMPSSFLISP